MEKKVIVAPVSGKVISLKELKDPVFSKYMMGVGVGIKAENNIVHAPITGVVTHIADTAHAMVISNDAMDIMIHIGIDTCKLKDNYFDILVKEGTKVTVNQEIMKVDFKQIEKNNLSNEVIMVIIENNNIESIQNMPSYVSQGDSILNI